MADDVVKIRVEVTELSTTVRTELERRKEREAYVHERVDKLHGAVYGSGTRDVGVLGQVRQLQDIEERRAKQLWYIWAGLVALALKLAADLLKNLGTP